MSVQLSASRASSSATRGSSSPIRFSTRSSSGLPPRGRLRLRLASGLRLRLPGRGLWRRRIPHAHAGRPSRRRRSAARGPRSRAIRVGDRVEQRAVVRDEQHRARERVERRLERLAALEVEMVRRLVEHEEVRAGRDDERERRAAAARRRRARRPASRASPSRRRGTARAASAPAAAAGPSPLRARRAREPRSSSSTSCCEKYAASTPWPMRTRPSSGSRAPSIVSSSVVLPEPFGPTSATCSPRSSANDAPSQQHACSPAETSSPSASTTIRPLRAGLRNSKPSDLRRLRQRARTRRQPRALLSRGGRSGVSFACACFAFDFL